MALFLRPDYDLSPLRLYDRDEEYETRKDVLEKWKYFAN
jgi:hypothetical protein